MSSEGNHAPSTPFFYSLPSDKNFHAVNSKKYFKDHTTKTPGLTKPPGPGSKRCKLCPGGKYGSYGKDTCINFREGSLNWKVRALVQFLSV